MQKPWYELCSRWFIRVGTVATVVSLAACSSVSLKQPSGGGYYKSDGPGDASPDALMKTPDAVPKIEPYVQKANAPYTVFGKTYTPFTDDRPFSEEGNGSWYGKMFNGKVTSSGDTYNMYGMSAAHPTLPIPSYARVTNLDNGKKVIVRINDRGPFHSDRIIDLSYTAALKLGYANVGSARLKVERILPSEIQQMQSQKSITGEGVQVGTIDNASIEMTSMPSMTPLPPPTTTQTAQAPAASNTPSAPVYKAPAVTRSVDSMTAASAASAATAATKGYYLQFGAFSQEANAQQAKQKLIQSLGSTVKQLNVVSIKGLYRVVAGTYSTREQALQVASQVEQKGMTKPFVLENK